MSRTHTHPVGRLILATMAGVTLGACDDVPQTLGPLSGRPEFSHIAHDALDTVLVTGAITGTRVFSQDTIYLLHDLDTVESGAILEIEEGTKILGDTGQVPTALIVEQGGRIEANGTAVDSKYALATRIHDDAFDYSTGWTGRGQFWIAQQADSADKGFEVDNNEFDFEAGPLTKPTIYNVTLVGLKTAASDPAVAAGNDGLHLRRGTGGSVFNLVVLGFRGAGLDVDDAATFTECAAGNLAVRIDA